MPLRRSSCDSFGNGSLLSGIYSGKNLRFLAQVAWIGPRMTPANFLRLMVLSAIWGASFMFMRIAAPAVGPTVTIFFRVMLGALFLLLVIVWLGKALRIREHWKNFLLLGAFNSALPFVLFAYAALTLPASVLAILNATTPIWGAVLAALVGGEMLRAKRWAGLFVGLFGVILLTGVEIQTLPPGAGLAVLAALLASSLYSVAATYISRTQPVEPIANANGSLWAATLWLLPVMWFTPLPESMPTLEVSVSVFLLGVMCSGMAYLLYFRLIREVGAVSTLTVTLLIPVFGIFWGFVFLDEAVGWHTVAGAVFVLSGTILATGVSVRSLLRGG